MDGCNDLPVVREDVARVTTSLCGEVNTYKVLTWVSLWGSMRARRVQWACVSRTMLRCVLGTGRQVLSCVKGFWAQIWTLQPPACAECRLGSRGVRSTVSAWFVDQGGALGASPLPSSGQRAKKRTTDHRHKEERRTLQGFGGSVHPLAYSLKNLAPSCV